MEFLVLMLIGTLIAIWAVTGSRPKQNSGVSYLPPVIPSEMNPHRQPEIWQYRPMNEIEHAAAIARYTNDSVHNPFPLPPLPPTNQ